MAEGKSVRLRSLLFVPGDRPDRFAKAAASGADAVILDLEDSVAAAARPQARAAIARYLAESNSIVRIVRINPLDMGMVADDLRVARAADAVMLPKTESAASIARLRALCGDGCPPILPIAAETPRAVFGFGSYVDIDGLLGLTWGAEDLSAAIGASSARREDGGLADPYQLVRSLTLFAAHAAGVPAIETVYPSVRDLEGLARYAAAGADDGFTGMMAIHPSQVAVINAAFTPDEAAVVRARRIVQAFAVTPSAGVLQLDGAMIDAPHVRRAEALLARAGGLHTDGGHIPSCVPGGLE